MNELDRYRPDDWSLDGVTTIRRLPQRQFRKRAKEKWLVVAAKATVMTFAVAALTPTSLVVANSDLVQHAAFADVSYHTKAHSKLRDVEAGYWPKLINFLDQFPRDMSATDFDPDPFT